MPRISVKAVKGRVARTSPNGPMIPHDHYMMVEDTKYIRRLLDFHKDITLEPAKVKSEAEPRESTGNTAPKAAPKTKE